MVDKQNLEGSSWPQNLLLQATSSNALNGRAILVCSVIVGRGLDLGRPAPNGGQHLPAGDGAPRNRHRYSLGLTFSPRTGRFALRRCVLRASMPAMAAPGDQTDNAGIRLQEVRDGSMTIALMITAPEGWQSR